MPDLTNLKFDIRIEEFILIFLRHMEKDEYFFDKGGREYNGLVYILEGSSEYTFLDKTVILKAGDLLSISQGCVYQMKPLSAPYRYYYLDYSTAVPSPFGNRAYHFKNPEVIRSAFDHLNTIFMQKRPGYLLHCRSVLYNILYEVYRNESAETVLNKKYKKIESAVEFLIQNYTDCSISIPMLAEITGLSEPHFRLLFREVYSVPPAKYLNLLRIERAKDLLRSRDKYRIEAIAEMTGYSSLYYFSSAFHRETGMSPSQYRRSSQING